ncbi:MAG: AMP-binding protein, partial [Arenicellales bacterium]|nr:AMP-binding protein [Arenicellales bacterium]
MAQNLDTFPKLLLENARRFGNRPASREKEYGIWQTWTWQQVADEVRSFACGLAARGFERGDKLGIIGDNRPRLYWAMAAAQSLGGVPVPTYQNATADEIQYVLDHAEVKFVLAEDQEQVDKILEAQDSCPQLQAIFYDDKRGLRD